MTSVITGLALAIVVGIILFTVGQSVLTSTSTTGWTGLQVTLAYILPTVLLIGIIILAFRAVSGRSK